MNIIYNTEEEIASKFRNFISNVFKDARKTQLNIIPEIMLGMIVAEASSASKIAKKLKKIFPHVQYNSIIKRIRRFYNNKLFDSYSFYDSIIRYVIKNYKLYHPDKRVHIIFDHMFSHDNYTVFMITMRIGKQGIPLWFRCFNNQPSDAFKLELLKEGIKYASDLFDDSYKLIFLADRWFSSTSLLSYIDSLGHTYVVRFKGSIRFTYYNEEGKRRTKKLCQVSTLKTKAVYLNNIKITGKKFVTNISISKRDGVEEPWIIATNGDSTRAIKDYGYRFGGIEAVFKNQKSNGFRIESINNSTIKSFTTMYTLVCASTLLLTIIGTDYTKNSSCYKKIKIETHKKYKNKGKVRVMSLFNVGLTLFNLALNSRIYIRLPLNFILYDL